MGKVHSPSCSNLGSNSQSKRIVFTAVTSKPFGLHYPSLAQSKRSVIFFVMNYCPNFNSQLFSLSIQRDLLSSGRSPGNIHWKFECFWASSFGATKVYYLPFQLKDGVKGSPIESQQHRKPKKQSFSAQALNWIDWLMLEMMESLSQSEQGQVGQ